VHSLLAVHRSHHSSGVVRLCCARELSFQRAHTKRLRDFFCAIKSIPVGLVGNSAVYGAQYFVPWPSEWNFSGRTHRIWRLAGATSVTWYRLQIIHDSDAYMPILAACLEELQGYSVLRRIASWPQYVPCIDRDMTVSSAQGGALWGAMKGGLLWIFTIVWNVLATLLHIVGCPPERLADSLRALNPFSARHTPTTSFSGMPVSTSVNTDVERGQRGAYTQLPQSQL
jgi:hypothetical protein